jgi:hypothetical protein
MLTTPPATFPRSGLPAHRLAEDLGAGRGLDLALAVVRDRGADTSRQFRRAGRAESGAGREGDRVVTLPRVSSDVFPDQVCMSWILQPIARRASTLDARM